MDAIADEALRRGASYRGRIVLQAGATSERHPFLEISDNGIGIPPDILPRIFHESVSTKSGLGGSENARFGGHGAAFSKDRFYGPDLLKKTSGWIEIDTRMAGESESRLVRHNPATDRAASLPVFRGNRSETGTTIRWVFKNPPAAGLEEGRGYVLVEGVGMLAPPGLPERSYYVVAMGMGQAAALIQAGRAPGRILAVATGSEEVSGLTALGVPGDQIIRAWDWPTLEAARNYAVRLGREWLAGLGGLQVSVLEATARSLQGILAQLQEILPSAWQTARPITEQDAVQVLEMGA